MQLTTVYKIILSICFDFSSLIIQSSHCRTFTIGIMGKIFPNNTNTSALYYVNFVVVDIE